MLELFLLGTGALAYWGFSKLYHVIIVQATGLLQADEFELAAEQLDWIAHSVPRLPSEKNRYALALNLLVYTKCRQGLMTEAQELCTKLLDQELTTPLRGLAHQRMAELVEQGSESANRHFAEADRLWHEGLDELNKLKLWETLAYFFWGTSDNQRAAYCIDRALEKGWKGQSLFLRYHCYSNLDVPDGQLLEMAEVALEHCKTEMQKDALYTSIGALQFKLREYESALATTKECRRRSEDPFIKDFARRLEIRCLRALEKFEEAERKKENHLRRLQKQEFVRLLGFLHDEGEHQQCLELLQPHLETEEPGLQYALGAAYLGLGHPSSAIAYFESTLDLLYTPRPAELLVEAYLLLMDRDNICKYLELVPPERQSDVDQVRAELCYFWDGNPDSTGDSPAWEATRLLYEGKFDEYFLLAEAADVETLAGLPLPQRIARINYQRGNLLLEQQEFKRAQAAFERADQHFVKSPYLRAVCRLRAISCRALLGENVEDEYNKLRKSLLRAYPATKSLHLEMQRIEIQIALSLGDHNEVLRSADPFLKEEPRALARARVLLLRAEALRGKGDLKRAEKDLEAVRRLVPGSYLAQRAEFK